MSSTAPHSRGSGAPLRSAEAAAALGVCERTLRRYIRSGRIRSHRLPGGHYRIPQEAIEEFWREHSPRPTPSAPRRVAAPAVRAGAEARGSERRRALAAEPREYDLSAAHLAHLRAARAPR